MKHYISICTDKEATDAKRIDLFDWSVLATLPQYAKKEKLDSMLVFNGYNNALEEYPRREYCLNKFSSIFIDCDNKDEDPDIITKWKEKMDGYDYMIYETASSTKERPKFRAIVPLDEELDWNKNAKTAIFHLFGQFADEKASWFFAPTLDKLPTIIDHTSGCWFPSKLLKMEIVRIEEQERIRQSEYNLKQMRRRLYASVFGTTNNAEGWRYLPSVKKCLDGLSVGERDNALCAACYAMDKNGYRDAIPQFLDECVVDGRDSAFLKDKWRKRYR